MRVYIVWVKGKIVTLKNPPGIMFHEYLVGRPYPRDTRETDSLARLFSFQSCVSHVATSQVSFSWNPLDLQLSLNLHQLNTKPNTIKSHKIQRTRLKQLQHFLSWNKVNIKHSCKSQLYMYNKNLFFNLWFIFSLLSLPHYCNSLSLSSFSLFLFALTSLNPKPSQASFLSLKSAWRQWQWRRGDQLLWWRHGDYGAVVEP